MSNIILSKIALKKFDGIYSLDVLLLKYENYFLKNICKFNKNGSLIIGMPSIESQKKQQDFQKWDINCKSKNELKNLLKNFFHHVFMFSMNSLAHRI